MNELYIGLMAGTSIDGIDAALVDFSQGSTQLIEFHYQAFSNSLRQRIHTISQPDQPILLSEYGKLDSELGNLFAEAVNTLLTKAQIPASRIKAIGSHGQTVHHAPDGALGFSLQIGDPNRIAQQTGITTIADFRRRDIALAGQGAPLVPAFHHAIFAGTEAKTIVNIGGIANITYLEGESVSGFDTGPGNVFLDYWCQKCCNRSYDQNGEWGASGQVSMELLTLLADDPYFRQPPPKSTGKEYFSPVWLEQKLSLITGLSASDVQATLCQLTATTIASAIQKYAGKSQLVLVCGGGAHNRHLIKLLRQALHVPLESTDKHGVNPDHVEAMAFAWLARQTLLGLPGNLCTVTGAKAPAVLGGIYPG